MFGAGRACWEGLDPLRFLLHHRSFPPHWVVATHSRPRLPERGWEERKKGGHGRGDGGRKRFGVTKAREAGAADGAAPSEGQWLSLVRIII